jgi:hypothetical protein
MAEAVYVLCALTSLACAVLLLRGYARRRTALLLWSGLCFTGFFVNNTMLFLDKVVITEVDLGILRALSGLIGLMFLVYGLVSESR